MSRDADFYERSLVQGAPPKVVWLNCGNSSTAAMMELLLSHADELDMFAADTDRGWVEVS